MCYKFQVTILFPSQSAHPSSHCCLEAAKYVFVCKTHITIQERVHTCCMCEVTFVEWVHVFCKSHSFLTDYTRRRAMIFRVFKYKIDNNCKHFKVVRISVVYFKKSHPGILEIWCFIDINNSNGSPKQKKKNNLIIWAPDFHRLFTMTIFVHEVNN